MMRLGRFTPLFLIIILVQACTVPGVSTSGTASTFAVATEITGLTITPTPIFTFTPASTLTPNPSQTFTPNPTATEEVINFFDFYNRMLDQVQNDSQICSDIIIWEYVKDFASIPEGGTVCLWNVSKTYDLGIGPPLCRMFAVSPPSSGVGQILYVRKNYSPVTKDPALVVVESVYFDQKYVDTMIGFGIDGQIPTPYGD